jgi:hypothetical protein
MAKKMDAIFATSQKLRSRALSGNAHRLFSTRSNIWSSAEIGDELGFGRREAPNADPTSVIQHLVPLGENI